MALGGGGGEISGFVFGVFGKGVTLRPVYGVLPGECRDWLR